MFRNYIKASFRIHVKNKLYSLINFIGLSVALMLCFLVYLFVQDEFSYDNFHPDGDRLFLLHSVDYQVDDPKLEPGIWDLEGVEGVRKSTQVSLPFLASMEEKIPEIESIIKVQNQWRTVLKDGEKFDENIHYTDTNFFEHFSYNFLHGNKETALDSKSNAVITKALAVKLFGKTDVVGNDLIFKGSSNSIYQISGVIEVPHNTMLNLNIIIPFENSYYYQNSQTEWNYYAVSAFIKLRSSNEAKLVAEKARSIFVEHIGDERLLKQREAFNLSSQNPVYNFGMKEIEGVYLDTSLDFNKGSSPLYSYILIAISIVILAIASINYLSISIASSASRRIEIAVRKVVGANLSQLRFQFYLEALSLTLLSVLGGFTLMQAFLPKFNELANKSLSLTTSENVTILSYGLFFGILISFIAGGYPAQILSRFKVLSGLKGKTTAKVSPRLIRGMVIFQFTLCLTFISVSLAMQKQFRYINNKDLGFDKDQMVMIGGVWGQAELIRQELEKYPSVEKAGSSNGIFVGSSSFNLDIINNVEHRLRRVRVGKEFFETLGLTFINKDGIPVPEILREDKNYISETYYDLLRADSVNFLSRKTTIGGVIKDFHFESLQKEVYPIQFTIVGPEQLATLFVKLKGGAIEQGIEDIKASYEKVTNEPLEEVRFMDDFLATRYKDSQKWQSIIDVSTALGILIASIGLFGLTGINLGNRMKEISIRKVLGAEFTEVYYILNKQTILLILVASVISIPTSYYLMDAWLSGFAYHVNISVELFLYSIFLLLVIALLTVVFHSVKSLKTNPVDVLRSE